VSVHGCVSSSGCFGVQLVVPMVLSAIHSAFVVASGRVQICAVRLRAEELNQAACLKTGILEDTPLACCLYICYICLFINLLKPKLCYICTTRFIVKKFSILPTMYLRVFKWISEQIAIISLYSINLSVFITKAESVYCAVRTGSLNQTNTVSSLKG